MPKIILIETSTSLCSVAIAVDGRMAAYREDPFRQHASLTAPFVQSTLEELGLSVQDCDAVCLSMGPGSYTGLRVGSSTAKGLCFGAGIPLIAVGSLNALAYQAKVEGLLPEGCKYIVPMIDARRMEVYSAIFSPDCGQLSRVESKIIDSESFSAQLSEGPTLFIGDGAGKCMDIITNPNAHFIQCCPKASSLLEGAMAAYEQKKFENLAYFKPFYLKDFIPSISKKKLPLR